MERTDRGYLEDEIHIKTSSKFSTNGVSDGLKVYASHSDMGCMSIFVISFAIILYFVSITSLIIFIVTLIISALGYLLRYNYTFKKKPVLVIDFLGIRDKDNQYFWEEMQDLSCSDEFDSERGIFTATHLRFIYRDVVKKIYIGGHDRSIEEIIHYVALFRK